MAKKGENMLEFITENEKLPDLKDIRIPGIFWN